MKPLKELLKKLAAAIAGGDKAAMESLRDEIRAEMARVVDEENLTDEVLALLNEAGDGVQSLQEAIDGVDAADADRKAKAKEALEKAGITDEADDTTDEGDAADEGTGEGSADDEGDADDDADEGTAAGDGDTADTGTKEPVLAGSKAKPPTISRVTARGLRQPKRSTEPPSPTAGSIESWGLVASANSEDGSVTAGTRIRDARQLAATLLTGWKAGRGNRVPGRMNITAASHMVDDPARLYGPERVLGLDPMINQRRIEAVTGHRAVVAAGGICAPINYTYDLPVLGDADRPFTDRFLTKFAADRGGVRTMRGPTLAELEDSITVWTHENDAAAAEDRDPEFKGCLSVSCPDDADATMVDAIVKCIQAGNFNARYFPELIEAWVRLAGVQHARQAEIKHINAVASAAETIQVSSGVTLSTTRDLLALLDRQQAQLRSYYRLTNKIKLQAAVPQWLLDAIRTDVSRQLPVGSMDETLAVTDARIEAWFTNRNLDLIPLLDGESGQVFGAQGDGAALAFPAQAIIYLQVPGTWLFLDGGKWDIGTVRDSTLNKTNEFQMFMETAEAVHQQGPIPARRLTVPICLQGTVMGTTSPDLCDALPES